MTTPSAYNDCRPNELTLFHYRELDAPGRLRVEQHLQHCAVCRRELAQLQATLDALPPKPAEITPAEIRAFNERLSRRLQTRRGLFARPALGWSLAAATAVLLLVTLQSPDPVQQQPARNAALHTAGTPEELPDAELLLNMDLLENLDTLQELEGTGVRG